MTAIAVTQPVDMPAGLRAGGRLSSEVGPSSSGVEHGSAPVGSLSEALHSLKLTSPPAEAALIDRVLAVLKGAEAWCSLVQPPPPTVVVQGRAPVCVCALTLCGGRRWEGHIVIP